MSIPTNLNTAEVIRTWRERLEKLSLPALEGATNKIGRCWYQALLIAVMIAAANITLLVSIDNTNLGTTNGLWKAPVVYAWGRGVMAQLDSGEILYADAYGHLARLIPDSLVQYGIPAPDVTFRKMAILNAIFGGIASGFVCLLAFRFTDSRTAAAVISLVHAGAGFVLLNSINSEDIVPAYAFLLGATVALFEFLYVGGLWWFALSALLLALATLFHWTVMVPGLAAFAAVFACVLFKRTGYFWVGAAWFAAFLVFLQALVLIALPKLHIPVWVVLYPGKADAGGWVGMFQGKFWNLLTGIGNYFSGANNFADYRLAFENKSVFRSMLATWAILAAALLACFWTIVSREKLGFRLLAVFAIVLFLVGEAGAVYSQPQDPQMQIEPMFAVIPGVILLARRGAASAGSVRQWLMVSSLALIAFANGAWNIHLMRQGAGEDSKALAELAELNALFPKDKAVIVCEGIEGWTTWQYVLLWRGNSEGFLRHSVHLARPFTMNRGITGAAAADMVTKQIDAAFAKGLRVVAAALWTTSAETAIGSFTTVTDEADARVYVSLLEKKYQLGRRWDTKLGPFVELLPVTAPTQL